MILSANPKKDAGYTIIEAMVGSGIMLMLVVVVGATLQVVTRRLANDRTRYVLSLENARAAHIISDLARRSESVAVYTNLTFALNKSAPAATGDAIAFTLSDGSRRFISFDSDAINFYTDNLPNPLTLAGGRDSNTIANIGTNPHCAYVQGLAQASWLAKAETTQGWTEQITYSAFAVSYKNH